jgi:hypothetical protein
MINRKDSFQEFRAQRKRVEWVSLLTQRGGLEPFQGCENGSKFWKTAEI